MSGERALWEQQSHAIEGSMALEGLEVEGSGEEKQEWIL